ncbi:hypothetical protein FNAPI_3025 [Fusarium napiforme]|uniref:Peptidase M3A/M3B catalytic domain-containing protein n=1 Tax=Fusarium napiforme TaxID=42672 RepID=A0A8H5JY30_9HYPO|nr:hypothetical protein FNAPI_3025 [Fusarium napiforme]
MTIEYPGFFVPVVSKLSWASLLYWSGPFSSGYMYEGPTGGMYTSNASYGLGFMTQMLRYPNMLNTLANSLINLIILISPMFFLLLVSFWTFSRSNSVHSLPFLSVLQKAASTTIGVALCFFSVPLLSYISYDLILVGYLPNYRIGLAVVMLLIILAAGHFLVRVLDDEAGDQPKPPRTSRLETNNPNMDFHTLWRLLSRHIPHTMPLLQAIGVGSLQDFPFAQLFMLIACEAFIIVSHLNSRRSMGIKSSTAIYISVVRLVVLFLISVFAMPITEATRQSVGYVVLALHGLVILIGFLIDHSCKLYKTLLIGTPVDRNSSSHSTSGGSDSSNSFQMDSLETHGTADLLEYRQAPSREPSRRDFQPDPSTLFRPPRSGATSPAFHAPRPATASSMPRSPTTDNSSPSTGHFSIDLALSEVALQPGIDYSFRESDRFYGIDEDRVFVSSTSAPDADTNAQPSSGLRYDETASGDQMDHHSLPQPLPRLIPADQILPTMKRIVGRYQAIREDIIQSVDKQTANFDNVVQPLIHIDNETQGEIAVIAMLRYASPDRASRQASEEACTLINEDQAAFTARADFWSLIKTVKANQDTSLHFEARKYLDKVFLEFKQFGHGTLQPAQIQEYLQRRNHIDSMRREYNQRIREDTGGLWFSIDELAGVQQHDLNRFGKDPDKHDMRFVRFSTSDSLVIYRNASKSATRKRMYIGYANNLSQNAELFRRIVIERDLNARLLGYESHAAYRLEKRLMKTPTQVEDFLADLHDKIQARGQQDMNLLMNLKENESREGAKSIEEDVEEIYPWDYWYYTRLAEQHLHVDPDQVAEYFPLQHVISVMLEMFSEFLRLCFCPISPNQLEGSTWHEDVRAYSAWDDREASKGQFIGYLYMDLLSRDSKYKGNQNVNLQCIISLFHELGHGIHDLLARTNYVAFHGHRSPPDFAETLSVMLEKWCWMKPEPKRLGVHYTRTELHLKDRWLQENPEQDLPPERIPDDIIKRLIKGHQATRSMWYLRQMVYAQFDMAIHHPKSHSELLEMDFTKVFNDLLEKLWLVRAPQPEDQGYPHADLGHLVSGYDAGYYSYLRRVDLYLATYQWLTGYS